MEGRVRYKGVQDKFGYLYVGLFRIGFMSRKHKSVGCSSKMITDIEYWIPPRYWKGVTCVMMIHLVSKCRHQHYFLMHCKHCKSCKAWNGQLQRPVIGWILTCRGQSSSNRRFRLNSDGCGKLMETSQVPAQECCCWKVIIVSSLLYLQK